MNHSSIVITLTFLVIIVLGWWGYSKLEWVETTVDLGFKQEARQNPYLAATKYLDEHEITVSDSRQWDSLDLLGEEKNENEYVGTLIVTSSRLMLGEHRQKQMWDWVQKGGHLITHAQAFTDPETGESEDELLNKLTLNLFEAENGGTVKSADDENSYSNNSQANRPWLHNATKFDEKSCPKEEYLVDLSFQDTNSPIRAAFTPGLYLEDISEKAVSWSVNNDGIQMIQYEIDEGLVTVMTDTSLWSNGKIACFDHAYLLWLLTNNSGGVHFLYNAEIASLWQLLWRHASFVVMFSGILLLLWIWKNSSRFGPFILIDTKKRRQLKEHLGASSMFLWSQKKYEKLYEPLQKSILSTITVRHHHVTKLNGNDRSEFISQLTQINSKDVHWALSCQKCENRNTFFRLIQTLQLIRNRL